MMIHATQFFLFLSAALLLAIAPGPGMLYVLARTLAGGKNDGFHIAARPAFQMRRRLGISAWTRFMGTQA